MVRMMLPWILLLSSVAHAQKDDCMRDRKIARYENLDSAPPLKESIKEMSADHGIRIFDTRGNGDWVSDSLRVEANDYQWLLSHWPQRVGFLEGTSPNHQVFFLGAIQLEGAVEIRMFQFRSDAMSFILGFVSSADRLRSVAEVASFTEFITTDHVSSEIFGSDIDIVATFPMDVVVNSAALNELTAREKREMVFRNRCYSLRIRANGTIAKRRGR